VSGYEATTEMICATGIEAPNHLNALRAFEAAARHLSYVAAVEELNVTPAAVGQLCVGSKKFSASSYFTALKPALRVSY
jgi:hypothetical protein